MSARLPSQWEPRRTFQVSSCVGMRHPVTPLLSGPMLFLVVLPILSCLYRFILPVSHSRLVSFSLARFVSFVFIFAQFSGGCLSLRSGRSLSRIRTCLLPNHSPLLSRWQRWVHVWSAIARFLVTRTPRPNKKYLAPFQSELLTFSCNQIDERDRSSL